MLGGFKSENQRPIEFSKHRFLIDLYADETPDIGLRKSAQCGGSVCFIMKAVHSCRFKRANVIYVLPTQNVVKDFVSPKVDPLISSNPEIAAMVSKDSVSLKQIGDRFLYFKGSSSEREAIAISGDILVLDELDRMMNMGVVATYDSRLQASDAPRRWRLSNPSGIGYGIDAVFNEGTQHHWFVKCSWCNHDWFIDFEPSDDRNHYVNTESRQYICGNPQCGKPITDAARQNGRWVAKYPGRSAHTYWLSQLMVPYVSADRIIQQRDESNPQFFANFVLGKAFTPSDLVVNRETILRACAPSTIIPTQVALGVDQKASELHWVAMSPQGVFAHGIAKSWEEVEDMKLRWNAVVVCDAMPYPTKPKQLASKYPDWYLCYFRESQNIDILSWRGSIVQADRTRLLDLVATEISEARLLFREHAYMLEDYIRDWGNIYRTTVESPDGRQRSTWLKKDGAESDFSFATCYARIALSRQLSGGSGKLIEASRAFADPLVTSTDALSLGDSVQASIDRIS